MNVEITNEINLEKYNKLLSNSYEATFYHSTKHILFLQKILKIPMNFFVASEKDKLLGLLPFFSKKSPLGIVVNSLPFFGSYGGFIADQFETQKAILNALNEYNKQNDVLSSVIIVSPFSNFTSIYEKFYKFSFKEERRIQCIDLHEKSQEMLWNEFEQRVRRAIRKGQKNNISISKITPEGDSIEKFYQMHKMDMESKGGRSKPKSFFENLNKIFETDTDYNLFCAKYDGREIAYLLTFYFNSYVEYYMPAYDSTLKHLQGTSVLLWESIKHALEKNFKFYNFGGTWKNQEELYRFKRGWAAKDMPYFYYIYGDIERAKKNGLEQIKKDFENFYVFSYDLIK
ncbi:peptidoglycan bridge formation glycyltransferase FemA/FemB family protein [Candidatus Nitrosotenuis uzonensis]|uniref:BioF2-like acetyltransferase domain-containing protein n=1 Tax=Candidatus Nitrosotenuis uzonensis TaxID=1407055 RepID=V6AV69_9ARCH|nr:peptidoglycan bridge formation glycyltransferase FemA/FemB family protein [Candidatus Nitrosotenuis uzonensis]CDI06454.1 conserved hypothetical protein [Candidatus Nitrosotenuis uzonensis]